MRLPNSHWMTAKCPYCRWTAISNDTEVLSEREEIHLKKTHKIGPPVIQVDSEEAPTSLIREVE